MLRIILISILICLLTLSTSSGKKYDEDEKRPYEFRFKIENNQHRYEKRDENGIVMGEFGFVTADGIYHHTIYATDEKGSFNIVAMQNLRIDEIDDLYNIPRPASVPKFEIVPLKATTPFSYNALATTQKPNIPSTQSKPLDKKTCSNCRVPTTKRPIPITFAPLQPKTQKPFGVGLPEKLQRFDTITNRQLDATTKPILNSQLPTRLQAEITDEYAQVKAPEDQTQPIQKSSIVPTQSTFRSSSLQKLQPQSQQNILPTTGKIVSTVKDSIQKVSLQQISNKQPANVQIIQTAKVNEPSVGLTLNSVAPENIQQFAPSNPITPPRFQSQGPVTPVPELSQTIQPPLLDNGPIEVPQVYIRPSSAADLQFENPVSPVIELNAALQPQVNANIPIVQNPVYAQVATPSQSQFERPSSQLSGLAAQPLAPQTISAEQPITFKQPSTSAQPQLDVQLSPIRGSISNVQTQLPQNVQAYAKPPSTKFSQPDNSVSPVSEFKPISQPNLLQNKPIDKSPVYTKETTPTEVQYEKPSAPARGSVNRLQPQSQQDIAVEQFSVFNRPIAPVKNQVIGTLSSISENERSPQPQQPPSLAFNQPTVSNIPPKPIQTKLDDSPTPIRGSIQFSQPLLPQNVPVNQPIIKVPVNNQLTGTVSSIRENERSPQPQQPPSLAFNQPTVSNVPSKSVQIQLDGSPSPIRGSIQFSQPLLPQNVGVNQQLIKVPLKNQLKGTVSSISQNERSPQPQQPPSLAFDQPTVSDIPPKPSQIKLDGSSSPIRGSTQFSQPILPQNVGVNQPITSQKPLNPTLTLLQNPPVREKEFVDNVQPQISTNLPGGQPVVYGKQDPIQNIPARISQDVPSTSLLAQSGNPEYPIQNSVQNIKEQITQNVPSKSSQVQSGDLVAPVQELRQNGQPQLPIQQTPIIGNKIVPVKYQTNYPEYATPQSISPTSPNPVGNQIQSNTPTQGNIDKELPYNNEIVRASPIDDNGKVLVVEPLSPAPEVRINLPKQLVDSPPRQIDSITSKSALPKLSQSLITELKETMLKIKNKPVQVGPVSFEPIRQFDKASNVPKMEQILDNILYRFNYTAGYHGHHEHGDQGGNKEGSYYHIARDGYRRIVDYTANEDGYRPKIHIEYAQPQDVPQEETEKEKGLEGYEFKWFYLR